MKSLLYVITSLLVIGLAFWAYHENYKTQEALGETDDLRRDIGEQRARLGMLRAEWAYLNRPDRLRELAEINFERLGLLPLAPDQFGRVDQVSYPAQKTLLNLENAVDVSSDGGEE
ncbi:cell division protein FtsL [Alisedimentitalea sp. MJ-SS2]|uniref:cell division protein FtsL n=1 Tax=Aliisedimentitalea sp. MJ-SS2 TaxID=3049795 RepID=UPI0029085D7F|nr:cell division protein FtsL [Alisedimentitalea sp. MJ-SS2]MDU8926309.1 cell division protein FtsL [Alisedimentitalea sp. MJ-SS2]